MRRSSVALVLLTAGLTASAVLRRAIARRRDVAVPAVRRAVPAVAVTPPAPVAPVPADDAVVLPFARRVVAEPVAAPERCGDTGGRTKAGAPCAARATAGGRCHHHRVAA